MFLIDMDYAAYLEDLKTRSAVERMLQILSAAAYRLGADAERLRPGIDWRGVRSPGNVLRHEDHVVDYQRIWDTLQEELPKLHKAVQAAFAKLRDVSSDHPA